MLFHSKINNLANGIPFKRQESRAEFEKTCMDSYDKSIKYQLSQYYVAYVLLLVLDVIVVLLLALMVFGYPVGFEAESAVASVVIIQYILYFVTTLMVIPELIEIWPRAYTTSVRLEEVLNLEDKLIKTKSKNDSSNGMEPFGEDIKNEDRSLFVDRKEIFRKFNMILDRHRSKVIISMILLAISTLCITYAPKVAGNIIDLILLNSDLSHGHAIFTNVILLFALYSVGCLFRLPPNRFMAFVSEEIAYNLRIRLFDRLDILDSVSIPENSEGHILSRMNHDLMIIKGFIAFHISEIFAQFLSIVFVIILILTTDWRLSMIYLITLPIYLVCLYYVDAKSKMPYENHQNNLGRMMGYFERSLSSPSPSHEKGFEKINRTVSDNFVKSMNISNVLLPIVTVLANLSNVTVYVVGVYFLINHEIGLGTLLAIIIYGQLLTKPIKKVSASMVFLEISFSSIKRIFEIIEFGK